MKMKIIAGGAALVFAVASPAWSGQITRAEAKSPIVDEEIDETPRDLLALRSSYSLSSDFTRGDFGSQDALQTYAIYSHRFPVFDRWYLRTGVEYERFDFGSSRAPLPSTLQSIAAVVAFEYVYKGYAGAAIELYPGAYFENDINSGSFDMRINAYATYQLTEKVFLIGGVTAAQFREYPVLPIAGVVWLISDDWRLEAVLQRPQLVYAPEGDWEFRLMGDFVGGGFRRDRDAEIEPRFRNAVLQYVEYRAGLAAVYKAWKPFTVTAAAGCAIMRSFDYIRAGRDFDTEPAPYFSLRVDAQF